MVKRVNKVSVLVLLRGSPLEGTSMHPGRLRACTGSCLHPPHSGPPQRWPWLTMLRWFSRRKRVWIALSCKCLQIIWISSLRSKSSGTRYRTRSCLSASSGCVILGILVDCCSQMNCRAYALVRLFCAAGSSSPTACHRGLGWPFCFLQRLLPSYLWVFCLHVRSFVRSCTVCMQCV